MATNMDYAPVTDAELKFTGALLKHGAGDATFADVIDSDPTGEVPGDRKLDLARYVGEALNDGEVK